MLEDSLFESQGRKKIRRPFTVVVSAMAHVVTVVVLVLIPLLQTQALTIRPLDMSLLLPRIQPSQLVEVFSAQPRAQKHPQTDTSLLTTPESIPPTIKYVDEPVKPNFESLAAGGSNSAGSSLIGIANLTTEAAAAPPQPPPPQPPPPPAPVIKIERLRLGGDVQAANLIHQVNPLYPALAKQARVQGAVFLEAFISKDGSIENLRVIRGHPLLTQAALDAVKQWKYRPTMLNGEPIEVVTEVTVTFTLQ